MERKYVEPEAKFLKMVRRERMKAAEILVGLADYYNENKGLRRDDLERIILERNLLNISNDEFLDIRRQLIEDVSFPNVFLSI